jgi:hypothetical protein
MCRRMGASRGSPGGWHSLCNASKHSAIQRPTCALARTRCSGEWWLHLSMTAGALIVRERVSSGGACGSAVWLSLLDGRKNAGG